MADPPARSGNALRIYQIILILGIGWLVGRVPALLADNRAEQGRLMQALQAGGPYVADQPAAPPDLSPSDAAAIASQVAAQVASEVANETVARLIAAGWGPQVRQPPQQIIIQQPGRAPETVVRVVTEPRPQELASLDYTLPPGKPPPPTTPTPAEQPVPAAKAPSKDAFAAATSGYAALKSGDKREGVRLLSQAVLLDPTAPQAATWSADIHRLTRRWALGAYTLVRDGGTGDPVAATPVLGGGQSGAAFAYTLDPLARRPISAFARVAAATGPDGAVNRDTAEAAIGLRVKPLPKVPLSVDVERRIALGVFGRNAWAARVSGGTNGKIRAASLPVRFETYGEAGMINFQSPDLYAGGQARAATPLFSAGRLSIDAGAGAWGGIQDSYNQTASRLDIGPSTRISIKPYTFTAQIDYRFRMAGNALPASGPALTVAGEF